MAASIWSEYQNLIGHCIQFQKLVAVGFSRAQEIENAPIF